MLFNSVQFLVFLVVVLGLYWVLKHRAQNLLLLAASYFFYGAWNWKFLGLILLTTLADFTASLVIANTDKQGRRKLALVAAIAVNLGVLGFFKYYNFFIEDVFVFLKLLGVPYTPLVLQIVLPVGISFYTFQSMSYTIDAYRGDVTPTENFFDYALYVAFFPQLVAGPIERAGHLLKQIQSPRSVSLERVNEGVLLIALGLFKKVAVADHLAQYVDVSFNRQTGWKLLIGLYFFAFQIYCDFSGYSDIARGCAKLFGIDLRLNFNRPYFARNLTEFWRRWHISLSTWFRDYVYRPLGGKHAKGWRPYRNLMLVFLLSGLWHGAAWTFVIWGAIHGVVLACEKALSGWRSDAPPHGLNLRNVIAVFVTFHIVCAAWVFFRAPTLDSALGFFERLVQPATIPFSGLMVFVHAVGGLALLFLWEAFEERWRKLIARPAVAVPAYASFLIFTLAWGQLNGGQFIYFQF
jgi:D-alanyl-lipoteichoic acid acyltransferase DltB (MBOAT superfamily)